MQSTNGQVISRKLHTTLDEYFFLHVHFPTTYYTTKLALLSPTTVIMMCGDSFLLSFVIIIKKIFFFSLLLPLINKYADEWINMIIII